MRGSDRGNLTLLRGAHGRTMERGENPRGIVGAERGQARERGVDGSGLVLVHGVGF